MKNNKNTFETDFFGIQNSANFFMHAGGPLNLEDSIFRKANKTEELLLEEHYNKEKKTRQP